jgi:transposase
MEERALYLLESLMLDPQDLIFIDETGTNLAMTRAYGRAEKGLRANSVKPVSKGKLLTLIGAVSLEGMIASMTVEGGTKKETFITYISDVLVPELKPGNVVIMDNLSAHKSEEVKELIESTGARLLYLPRYSPDLSPIELCWSKLKSYLKKKAPRNSELLQQFIKEALELITLDNIKSWFSHCGYFAI